MLPILFEEEMVLFVKLILFLHLFNHCRSLLHSFSLFHSELIVNYKFSVTHCPLLNRRSLFFPHSTHFTVLRKCKISESSVISNQDCSILRYILNVSDASRKKRWAKSSFVFCVFCFMRLCTKLLSILKVNEL